MSGQHVPYHLRPNKYIDRQAFMELAGHVMQIFPDQEYIYTSMGGKFLDDIKHVHNKLNIKKLYSIEQDENTYKRQLFNKPIDLIECSNTSSSEFIDNFDDWVSENEYLDNNFIIWLDYAAAKRRREQLSETSNLVSKLTHGDLIKITLNANVETLGSRKSNDETKFELSERRVQNLKSQLSEYFDDDIEEPEDLKDEHLCQYLLYAAKKSFLDGTQHNPDISIIPLSITAYSDTHTMLTLTCMVVRTDEVKSFVKDIKHRHICFDSIENWNEINRIFIPDLSIKEKVTVDEMMHKKRVRAKRIAQKLGFNILGNEAQSLKAIENYCNLYRYYPHFFRADL